MSSLGSNTRRGTAPDRDVLLAAGGTDPGIQREVNEDRVYIDAARGIFAVIDGVGGQAAGGRAADVALSILRERLERDGRPVGARIAEAIAAANNEIHRLAATRAEWQGMACVLTIAIVDAGKATIGHVGDTRLYKIRGDNIEKVTRDHSPVGEREDAGDLSEAQAMKHPRRNEVYRDVGSDLHRPEDEDFIDLDEVPFEPDTALLLCTDGLTDLVDSASIIRTVSQHAGDPDAVVTALIDAANAAGGKDNVTVVYVEGDQFAGTAGALPLDPGHAFATGVDGSRSAPARPHASLAGIPAHERSRAGRALLVLAAIALLGTLGGIWLVRSGYELPWRQVQSPSDTPAVPVSNVRIVQPGGSIADAIRDSAADSAILVEPGEYREQLVLKDRVRVVSRVPRAATIRLPAAVPDGAPVPAIVASGLSGAELVGFRIVGDSATPLSLGVRIENSAIAIVDTEIIGATTAAVDFSSGPGASLIGSDIHDNPGAAVIVRDGATPRIAHTVFAGNGTSERARGSVLLMPGAGPRFTGNVFVGLGVEAFASLDAAARLALKNENWFVPVSQRRAPRAPSASRLQRNK